MGRVFRPLRVRLAHRKWGRQEKQGQMTTGKRDDRGATLVEAALVYALLFLALFAVVEFGLAFKDWLSVSHAAREGARAGATYGDDPTADIQILRDVERTLAPAGIAENINVRIFDAET